jgi:DHA1 family multidrug resistance protein-like MFS transporter
MNRSLISPVILPLSMGALFGLVLLGVPFKATSLGATFTQLGYIGAIAALSFILFVAIAGRLIGRITQAQAISIGCITFALCSFYIGFLNNLGIIYPLVAGYSLGLAFYWPALESRLGDVSRITQVIRRTGIFSVSVSVGFTIGFLLSGILFEINPRLPFIIASGLALFLPIIFILDRPMEHAGPEEKTPLEAIPEKPFRYLYIAWMSNAASHFSLIILSNIFPKLGIEIGMTETQISILLFSLRLLMSIAFAALILYTRWHFSIPFLVSFQLIQILGLILVASVESMPLFALAFMMVGAGASVTYFASLYYGLVLSRKSGVQDISTAGRHSGLHEFYLGLGILTGPLAGGAAADYISIRSPYIIAAAITALMILAELIYMNLSRPDKDQTRRGSLSTS